MSRHQPLQAAQVVEITGDLVIKDLEKAFFTHIKICGRNPYRLFIYVKKNESKL
jgi:hypothetical protein